MSVSIKIQFNARQIIIPVNPEDLKITRSATNSNIDIVGIGKATRKGEPGLITTKIKSFFPSKKSYFYTGTSPKTYIDFINEIWYSENTNNNVAKIITEGLQVNLNMYFVIDSFEYDHEAGDEDIGYTLSIKQYIPYGVKLVNAQLTGLASARVQSTTAENINNSGETAATTTNAKTYTVQSGDSLFTITKRCTGNGSQWNALYELNKDKINNPNLIYPGQTLILPTDWNSPVRTATPRKVTNKTTTQINRPNNSEQIKQNIAKHAAAHKKVTQNQNPPSLSQVATGGKIGPLVITPGPAW